MKNLLSLAAVSLLAATASAAGSNEDFVKAAVAGMDKPAEVAAPKSAPVAPQAAAPGTLTESQYATMISLAKRVKSCPAYSLNYGRNKPYEDSCVELMVRSATEVFASFLPDSGPVIRDMSRILNCPTYSVNYGRHKPYEEGCVDNLVEVVVGHLNDKAKAAAAPAPAPQPEARKFFSRW